MKWHSLALLLLLACQSGEAVTFRVVRFPSLRDGAYDELVARYSKGISLFREVLGRSCGLSEVVTEAPAVEWDLPRSELTLGWEKAVVSTEPRKDGFGFRYYQRSFFQFLERHRSPPFPPRARNEVMIWMLGKLEGHYAFAFPRVQFPPEPLSPAHRHIVDRVKNHVVVDAGPQALKDPVNYRRVLAHELAHLFVQDAVPHQCLIDGSLVSCPGSNLLAVTEWVPPEPAAWRGPGSERGEFGPTFGFDDGLVGRQREARGTELTESQCAAVRETLKDLGG